MVYEQMRTNIGSDIAILRAGASKRILFITQLAQFMSKTRISCSNRKRCSFFHFEIGRTKQNAPHYGKLFQSGDNGIEIRFNQTI